MENDNSNAGYETGYGKPPQHTRFRKRKSGNSKGRPRGSKNMTALLGEALGDRQVGTQLWSEIHRAAARSKIRYPDFNQTGLKLRGENNFALGLATNKPENFQGYHGRHVLILADEAPGIESGIWNAIAGVMSGGKVHIVMAGNPTMPSGAFFDAFNDRALWNCITMDSARIRAEGTRLIMPTEHYHRY